MSDVPQGPGWWQASDDKWYPPPRPEMPGEDQPPTIPVTSTPSGDYPPQMPPTQAMGPYAPPLQGPPMAGAPHSPYAGMPPAAPPPGAGQNRTPLFVAIGVLGALVFVGLIIILTSGGDDDDGETTGSTTTSVTATDSTVAPPDSGPPDDGTTDDTQAPPSGDDTIRTADRGFAVSLDQLWETEYISYGAILENTTDQVATGVNVSIGFLDSSGTVIATDTQVINVLMPGQTFGVGNAGIEINGGEPVEMQVDVGEPSSWESPDSYGEISVSGINTTVDDYGAPTTTFTAESTYDEQIQGPYAFAIYRNSSGDIVGGDWDIMNFIQADGSSTGEVTGLNTVDDIDAGQTEVYIDPGFLA